MKYMCSFVFSLPFSCYFHSSYDLFLPLKHVSNFSLDLTNFYHAAFIMNNAVMRQVESPKRLFKRYRVLTLLKYKIFKIAMRYLVEEKYINAF